MHMTISTPWVPPDDFELGSDILGDMAAVADLPAWPHNVEGNAHVPGLGHIKMNKIAF